MRGGRKKMILSAANCPVNFEFNNENGNTPLHSSARIRINKIAQLEDGFKHHGRLVGH